MAGPATLTLRAAREEPGAAQVTLYTAGPGPGGPARGEPLGTVTVPCTGGRYRYAEVTGPLRAPAPGGPPVTDVYLVLDGPVRLAALGVHR